MAHRVVLLITLCLLVPTNLPSHDISEEMQGMFYRFGLNEKASSQVYRELVESNQDMNKKFCFEEAGRLYGVSPLLLWGIAKVESKFNPRAINYNSNGTYDFGVMQINSTWYRILGKEIWSRLAEPCFNIHVGAWVLAQCVQRYGHTWRAVGCYNASSEKKRVAYAQKIAKALNISYR